MPGEPPERSSVSVSKPPPGSLSKASLSSVLHSSQISAPYMGLWRFRSLRGASIGERVEGDPFCSLLSDESYGQFDRELFVATLNDWGWFGDGQPPDWYEGTPWTQ